MTKTSFPLRTRPDPVATAPGADTINHTDDFCSKARHRLKSVLLKWLASGETGFDIMPPLETISFVCFPAEQDDAAVAHRGKVDQTLLIIFKLDSQAFQLSGVR